MGVSAARNNEYSFQLTSLPVIMEPAPKSDFTVCDKNKFMVPRKQNCPAHAILPRVSIRQEVVPCVLSKIYGTCVSA